MAWQTKEQANWQQRHRCVKSLPKGKAGTWFLCTSSLSTAEKSRASWDLPVGSSVTSVLAWAQPKIWSFIGIGFWLHQAQDSGDRVYHREKCASAAMLWELVWKGPQFADMYSMYPIFLFLKWKCPVMPIQVTEAKTIILVTAFLDEYHFSWHEWFPTTHNCQS